MSRHSLKSRRRHPAAAREALVVGHLTFEVAPDVRTFALLAGEAVNPKDRRPLFTGHIDPGMPGQLRAFADRLDQVLGKGEAPDA